MGDIICVGEEKRKLGEEEGREREREIDHCLKKEKCSNQCLRNEEVRTRSIPCRENQSYDSSTRSQNEVGGLYNSSTHFNTINSNVTAFTGYEGFPVVLG